MKMYSDINIIDNRTGEIFQPLQAYTIPQILRKLWLYVEELNDCDRMTITTYENQLIIAISVDY